MTFTSTHFSTTCADVSSLPVPRASQDAPPQPYRADMPTACPDSCAHSASPRSVRRMPALSPTSCSTLCTSSTHSPLSSLPPFLSPSSLPHPPVPRPPLPQSKPSTRCHGTAGKSSFQKLLSRAKSAYEIRPYVRTPTNSTHTFHSFFSQSLTRHILLLAPLFSPTHTF